MKTSSAEAGIALVGMSCRFPGAADVAAFWRNVCAGVESLTQFSDGDVAAALASLDSLSARYAARQTRRPTWVKAGFQLEGADLFDAEFFGYNPNEAELLDPQQRLFLECAWETMEHGGYDPGTYRGLIGVYAGTGLSRYFLFNVFSHRDIIYSERDFLAGIGNEPDYLPTRVSYKLNLRGPSLTVQTACSTALVAVHMACQALLAGECDMALAGASNVQVPLRNGYLYQEGSMASPDGHCRPFDAQARGTVFSNGGVGCVLLKRVEDALADGDTIHALIRGSAVNNDGSRKIGYTAPGVEGQVAVVSEALAVARLEPGAVGYVEAHGTGTPLGDPIEVTALSQVFGAGGERRQYCALGSVKGNVGHLGPAAGMAGLIKAALVVREGLIPPSINFERPNPRIDFENSPFFVNTRLREWPSSPETPRCAGVSSFGVGGTNAHVLIEEPAPAPETDPGREWQILPLSARTPAALERATENLAAHLQAHPQLRLADVAHTLQVGRAPLSRRLAVVCHEGEAALALRDSTRVLRGDAPGSERPVAFLFSGQGAQHPNMGRALYEQEPAFREVIDAGCARLEPLLGLDLRTRLFPAAGREEQAAAELRQTGLTQPALFLVEYALVKLLAACGVRPSAMIGHSIGEYVAACVADVFTFDDALALVAERGRLMQELPPGAMLSVPLSEAELLPLLPPELSLAAVNAPRACVAAGETAPLEAFEEQLRARGLGVQRLRTSHAFHSAMMDPVLERFAAAVAAVPRRAPQARWVSNRSGDWIQAEQATDPHYWAAHLRHAVRFAQGVDTLAQAMPEAVLLEVGPGQTLSTLARQCAKDATALASLPHPSSPQPASAFFCAGLARLWLAGVPPDWSALHAGERRRRVPLPTYPFERRRYWLDARRGDEGIGADAEAKLPLDQWFYTPSWKRLPPVPAPAGDGRAGARRVLLFGSSAGLAPALAAALRAAGHEVITAAAGAAYARTATRAFELRPTAREDYERLFASAAQEGFAPDAVVHLWLSEASGATGRAAVEEGLERGFRSVAALAQAFAAAGRDEALELTVVSRGVHDVTGRETLHPAAAPVLGLLKVLPLEQPLLRCRHVDVGDVATAGEALDALALRLVRELAAPVDEPVLAYRDGRRWAAGYERLSLEAQPPGDAQVALRERGVYLITGGFGGLGLTFAAHLAEQVRARLALVSRTAVPPREEWTALRAAAGTDEATLRRLAAIQRLEDQGAEVLALQADADDETAMATALRTVRERFGHVDGVIHAAGLPGVGLLQLKSADAAERVLAPKVRGTELLGRLLADDPPDFLLLCSSLYAVTGGLGQADYAAGNAYMDAFAQAARRDGRALVLSLDWDGWDEVGMAAHPPGPAGGHAAVPATVPVGHPLLDGVSESEDGRRLYVTRFSPARHWLVDEHRILGQGVVPATAYLEMARAAVQRECHADEVVEISDVFFTAPLVVAEESGTLMRFALAPTDGGGFTFAVSSSAGERPEGAHQHAAGRVRRVRRPDRRHVDLESVRRRCPRLAAAPYERRDDGSLSAGALRFGPRWDCVESLHVGTGEALVRLSLRADLGGDVADLGLHPALLDMATGPSSGVLFEGRESGNDGLFLPFGYERVLAAEPLPAAFYAHLRARAQRPDKDSVAIDVDLVADDGRVLVAVEGFVLRRVAEQQLQASRPGQAAPAGRPEAIRPEEGIEAWRRLLRRDVGAQVVVSTRSLPAVFAATRARHAGARETDGDDARTRHERRLATAYVAPRTPIERTLSHIWQGVLGLAEVGVHDNFFELGADSVLGIQVVARAREHGLQITPGQLFEHQTVAELAAAIAPPAAADEAPQSQAPREVDAATADVSGSDLDALMKLIEQGARQPR